MTCSACSANVEKSVRKLEGVSGASVSLLLNSMTVEHDEAVDGDTIIKAVQKSGYDARIKDNTQVFSDTRAGASGGSGVSHAQKRSAGRLWWSIGLLIVLMYFSMGGMWGLLPPFLSGMENAVTLALIQLLLTLPILLLNGAYFTRGIKSLFRGAPNMDSLIAVGAGAAVIYGLYALFVMSWGLGHGDMELVHRYHMDLYFESAGMIVTLISVGKYLELRSKGKTGDAIKKLLDMSPKTAVVVRQGNEQEIPVEQVVLDDIVLVRTGGRVPVDGILQGEGVFDQSALTGESIPAEKTTGDDVLSGSILVSGSVRVRASRVGQDTTLAQIVRLVQEANSGKAPIAKLADRVSGVFVPVVLIISIITFIVWMAIGQGFDFALSCAICVLVISCPCALGLATPTAIMVGTGKGAEMGILFRSAESLETLHKVKSVVMDKTGTVTMGKPSVAEIEAADESELLRLAAAAENLSEHPLARAVVEHAQAQGMQVAQATDFSAAAGRGIMAVVEGKKLICGNRLMLSEAGVSLPEDSYSGRGLTPLYFAADGKYLGCIALADKIKPGSREAVSRLQGMGLDTVLLTGDNKSAANAIAAQAGIKHVIAEVLPADKEQTVASLARAGAVAMVGDGVNDAPALARADVGIAIGAGADIAIESADVVLMKSDPLDIPRAIRLSSAVLRNIKQNLFWAFFYNAVGIPLAAGVFYFALEWRLSPMFGAAAMSLSSVCVVGNALRLRFFRPDREARFTAGNKAQSIGAEPPEVQMREDAGMSEADSLKQNHINQNEGMSPEFGGTDTAVKKIITIEGMSCGHCSARVEKALRAAGAQAVVDLEGKKAYVTGELSDDRLKKCVEDAGYEVVSITEE